MRNGKPVINQDSRTASSAGAGALRYDTALGYIRVSDGTNWNSPPPSSIRVVTLTDAATVTPNADTTDLGILTTLSQNTTFANPTGTPTNGQSLMIRITSSTSRGLTFGTAYQGAGGINLPTATTGDNFEDYIGFRFNSLDSRWDLVASTIGQAIGGGVVVTASISTNQNDYTTTGISSCNVLEINPTASVKLTGLEAQSVGKTIEIKNSSTDFLLWLEHENNASLPNNRFTLNDNFPLFLMPRDRVVLRYAATNRWEVVHAKPWMGLTEFTDFVGGLGPFISTVSGTGASTQISNYLINTTERPMGVMQIDTGTTNAGRATIGFSGTDGIVPTLGAGLSVVRLATEAANSGTETYQIISGFADSAGGTFTDGVAWNLRWNGSAAEWSQDRLANGVATRSVVGSPTPDLNYIWLVVFVNPAWTRADFIFSTDSISFTRADSPTTGLPGSARNTGWVAASLIKSVGTTQRNCSIDLAGYRITYNRG